MKYPFTVYQTRVDNHTFWVAECPTLKGCVGQGESPELAQKELEENEELWLSTAAEYDMPIPSIPTEISTEYSGKFTARIAPHVHKEAARLARSQGISLNQYVNDAIIATNSQLSTLNYISPRICEIIWEVKNIMGIDTTLSKSKSSSLTYQISKPDRYSIQNRLVKA